MRISRAWRGIDAMAKPGGNPQNLKTPTAEEARIKGAAGGKASAKARKKKKTMREMCGELMAMNVVSAKTRSRLGKLGYDPDELTNGAVVLVSMFNQAAAGNVKAAQFIRDTMGEMPAEYMHKEDMKLKKAAFEHQKEKDAGDLSEVEDLDALDAAIYVENTEEETEENAEKDTAAAESDDSV